MRGGMPVDMTSGRPLEEVLSAAQAGHSAEKAKSLKEQAEYAGIKQSAAGQKLIGMISHKLHAHIRRVLANDPEAACLLEMLKELQYKENFAQVALEKLMTMGDRH